MRHRLTILALLLMGVAFATSAVGDDFPKGTANSRPNLSGGYDFYDSSGKKIGYSSKHRGGGYDYYNQHGNKTGSLKPSKETGVYQYYDADNIRRGRVATHPYGGYRYYEKKEGFENPQQKQIRRDYEYENPYGSGIETLPPGVIKGEE